MRHSPGMGNNLVGYSRVSTSEQNPDLQHDALTAAGCSPTPPVAHWTSAPNSKRYWTTCAPVTCWSSAALAEFEREIIRERTRAGLDAARIRGPPRWPTRK